ncbi:MAG: hypothetical protein NZZ60_07610 [Bacteroidia bacterium]|nr:hypothetical protein [Bacteroidia bacterium]MCX7652656.1 hypothetical protein [Bacteroidia bacterium]MDW8416990.1 hypothetical protein [Bacteroidia bacterium]
MGFFGGWIVGDGYYVKMRSSGKWILHGEGPLWDSAWVMRHIYAVRAPSPSMWIWSVSEALGEQQVFEAIKFHYTGKGDGRIYARTRTPIARVNLPIREYYLDAQGRRLPFVRPLDVSIVDAPRWDSIAFEHILELLREKPLYREMISRIYQEIDGVWHMHSEVSSETYVLGRTPHLRVGLRQLDVYLHSFRPMVGGNACKKVILYIPDQIICQ